MIGPAATIRPRRSALYLPATNARALARARELPCDAVILDLEDAVAPDAKDAARAAAAAAVRDGGWGGRELVVRVNGAGTPWGADDLAALAAAPPDAVLIPKVSDTDPLAAARRTLGERGPMLWAMVETCRGVIDLDTWAGAGRAQGLAVLVAGTNDLAKEMRCRPGPDRGPLLPILTAMVLAGRAARLSILDGVCNAIGDGAVLGAECAQGLAWGFDGKTLIHPSQVEVANRAFTPGADEVAWARTVVAAFEAPEAAGRSVLRVEGRMVELLHAEEARRTLAVAEACGAA